MWHRCNNSDDCKTLFRKLSMRLHPDHGGSNELIILLQESYDQEIKLRKIDSLESKKSFEESNEFWKVYEKSFENIEEGDLRLNIINEIMEYAKTHKKFITTFTESVIEFFKENKFITSNQFYTLVKIYYSFNMDKK